MTYGCVIVFSCLYHQLEVLQYVYIYIFPQSAFTSLFSSIYFNVFLSYFGQMSLCQSCSRRPEISSSHSATRHKPPSDPGRHPTPLSSPLSRTFHFAHQTPLAHPHAEPTFPPSFQRGHMSVIPRLNLPSPCHPQWLPPCRLPSSFTHRHLWGVDSVPGSLTGVGVIIGKTQTSCPS